MLLTLGSMPRETRTLQHMFERAFSNGHNQPSLVIGSGENTNSWRKMGFVTLDIDPKHGADRVLDITDMSEELGGESFRVVIAENVALRAEGKPSATNEVDLEDILRQCYEVLAEGGELFITSAQTIKFDIVTGTTTEENSLPLAYNMMLMLKEVGFQGVAANRYDVIFDGADEFRHLGDNALIGGNVYIGSSMLYYGGKPNPEDNKT